MDGPAAVRNPLCGSNPDRVIRQTDARTIRTQKTKPRLDKQKRLSTRNRDIRSFCFLSRKATRGPCKVNVDLFNVQTRGAAQFWFRFWVFGSTTKFFFTKQILQTDLDQAVLNQNQACRPHNSGHLRQPDRTSW